MNRPKTLIVELTNRCNADCVYCGRGYLPVTHDMDFDMFTQIVDSLPAVKKVHPQGFGEPLLYPRIIEAVRYIAAAGKEAIFYTNASLLTDTIATGLLDAGMGHIVFSIDSGTPEEFERTRRRLKWDTVFGNIVRFQRLRDEGGYRTETSVRMCKTRENTDTIDGSVRFWKQYVDVVTTRPEVDIAPPTYLRERMFEEHRGRISCRQVNEQIVVRANGVVVLCCVDWFGCYPIVDLKITGISNSVLMDAFNDPRIANVRRGLRKRRRTQIPTLCIGCKGIRPPRRTTL